MDRVRNEQVCRRVGIEKELVDRVDQRVLRWFGHIERMNEYRLTRRVLRAKVNWVQVWGRLRLGLMDGVQITLGSKRDES